MEKKLKKQIGIFIAGILFFIFTISFIFAFAVSSSYYKGNPLKLSPGETRDISLVLQNMAGGENISAKASISKGSEIIKLIDSDNLYFVPLGGKTGVNLRVTIPSNAKIGDVYNIEIMFVTVADAKSGTFGFGSGIEQKFDVEVISLPTQEVEKAQESAKKPESKINKQIIIIIAILVIIILIILFFFRINKNKKKTFSRAKL